VKVRWRIEALGAHALALAGCVGSCGGSPVLAEKRREQWSATVRCESLRNVIAPTMGGVTRMPAYSARVLFVVEASGGRRVHTIVPGGLMDDDDQRKLDATCSRLRATIEHRESAEGTVFAASIEGQSQSAVILRAPNGALFASPMHHPGVASAAAQTHPTPLASAVAMLTDGTLKDAAGSAVFDAIDDGALSANRPAFLQAAERCNAPTWLVAQLLRQSPDETADRLFEATYVRASCSRSRLAFEDGARDLAGPRVRRWIDDNHAAVEWPAGIERYAEEHSIRHGAAIAVDGGATDAASSDSATTATGRARVRR
jgi:hypothetical protein